MNGKRRRDSVLVIDDDPDFRELLKAVGQLCCVPVLEAADCGEGLRVLGREQAHIKMILLDYFMPGMTPPACARAISEKAGPKVSVVLVTAAADPASRASELQLNRWICKPVDLSILNALFTEEIK